MWITVNWKRLNKSETAPLFSAAAEFLFYFIPVSSDHISPSLAFLSLSFLLSTKECAGFPQALKESLTLHSHNHFRPGCLGRHLRWDSPAASQIRPLSGGRKKGEEEEKKQQHRNKEVQIRQESVTGWSTSGRCFQCHPAV